MISLGCPKNQVDAEAMLASLEGNGCVLADGARGADVVIVNTCGFIEDAVKESIESILEAARLKKDGRIKGLVVTGCLAQRYFEELKKEFPEVDCVVSVGREGEIAAAVRAAAEGRSQSLYGRPQELVLSGQRVLTTPPYYAYIKIADGCDNRCTYCTIPKLRGPYRSRPAEEICGEAQALAQKGVKELILIAQDTTGYGTDLYGSPALPGLLKKLCGIQGLRWIRLLYCYPEKITDELLNVVAGEEKLVNYLDMPIQHVSPRIVRAMNRSFSHEELWRLISQAREIIKGVTLRTTLITGFPGESEEEFGELVNFVKEVKFDRLGVFPYSREDGTPAAGMPGQLPEEIKKRRREIVMEEQMHISGELGAKKAGTTIEVLCEGENEAGGYYTGRSRADAPGIDGRVIFSSSKKIKPGQIINVKITGSDCYDLSGKALV
jgi:ribosomal protein S12 methylthiotransferase